MPSLYVGNLPPEVSSRGLREMFGHFGEVGRALVITDPHTGLSRGFGFVDMADESEAWKAIHGLSGRRLDQEPLSVELARPRSIDAVTKHPHLRLLRDRAR